MSNVICSGAVCSACGACENICPKRCITRIQSAASITMVKGEGCTDCGLCEKVCPGNSAQPLYTPLKAYAAWSLNEEIRRQSASGGIAASLYQYCLGKGYTVVGAELGRDFTCHLRTAETIATAASFQNSKYTYSFADQIYQEVNEKLLAGIPVLMIGLPCQVAAVRSYLKNTKVNTERFLTADIVCHGTPHPDYLQQHVQSIEKKRRLKAAKVFFRDPKYGTGRFAFTIYEESMPDDAQPRYAKFVEDDDLYQIGYHSALIYRDSCYVCPYAKFSRGGDFTLGDYHVKDVDACDLDTEKKSLILVNTEKGQRLVLEAAAAGVLGMIERPLEEPRQGEPQLRHPSVARHERTVFVQAYEQVHDFDQAAGKAFRKIVLRRRLKIDRMIFRAKMTMKKLIPKAVYRKAKQIIKGS